MQQRRFKDSFDCTLFPLGWIRLERMIELKKILFICFILILDDDVCVKRVFWERAIFFIENPEVYRENAYRSPVLDLLVTACNFG